MKFFGPIIMALSLTTQLATALGLDRRDGFDDLNCYACIDYPGGVVCVNKRNLGCGICCHDVNECLKARQFKPACN
ncbi:hypothetical protein Vi05172_g7138 [Venturia inaequalis]|nr:hypothetical protein Vi05172_g7138 [Venturia inaequalis]